MCFYSSQGEWRSAINIPYGIRFTVTCPHVLSDPSNIHPDPNREAIVYQESPFVGIVINVNSNSSQGPVDCNRLRATSEAIDCKFN